MKNETKEPQTKSFSLVSLCFYYYYYFKTNSELGFTVKS